MERSHTGAHTLEHSVWIRRSLRNLLYYIPVFINFSVLEPEYLNDSPMRVWRPKRMNVKNDIITFRKDSYNFALGVRMIRFKKVYEFCQSLWIILHQRIMLLVPGSHILMRGLEILLIDDEIIELHNVFLVGVHLFPYRHALPPGSSDAVAQDELTFHMICCWSESSVSRPLLRIS